jgi:hypothetical protein
MCVPLQVVGYSATVYRLISRTVRASIGAVLSRKIKKKGRFVLSLDPPQFSHKKRLSLVLELK